MPSHSAMEARQPAARMWPCPAQGMAERANNVFFICIIDFERLQPGLGFVAHHAGLAPSPGQFT